MLYYDDRDYLDYNNIDELYDHSDNYGFDDEEYEDNVWEYDYHNMTNELVDD